LIFNYAFPFHLRQQKTPSFLSSAISLLGFRVYYFVFRFFVFIWNLIFVICFGFRVSYFEFGSEMVPGEGLEPTSSYERRILSPLRLPIPPSRHVAYFTAFAACISTVCKKQLEATSGFGPLNGSFADSCLTTWLRRLASLL